MMHSLTFLAALALNIVLCSAQEAPNPLAGKKLYLNPNYVKKVDATIAKLVPGGPDFEKIQANLKIARESSTAIHISPKKVLANSTDPESMDTVLADAAKVPGTAVVMTFSNIPKGKNGTCAAALASYKTDYVGNIVRLVTKYKSSVTMALIIESNAVGWMTTDQENPMCEDLPTQKKVWKEAVNFFITSLNKVAPEVPLYLGMAHSGWIGSVKNSQGAVDVVKEWDVVDKIRGFALNIGNYQPVGKACPEPLFCLPEKKNQANDCCIDPCVKGKEWSENTEMNLALRISSFFPGKKFVIDTGRNGVSNSRSFCGNWCNIRNTGLGLRPTADTKLPLIDAFLWIKPPGETSGCTEYLPSGEKCKYFMVDCASADSMGSRVDEPRMPNGGEFSDFMLIQLARLANYNNVVVPAPVPKAANSTLSDGLKLGASGKSSKPSNANALHQDVFPILVIVALSFLFM